MKRLLLCSILMFVGQVYSMPIVHKIQAHIDPEKVVHRRQEYTQRLLALVQVPSVIHYKKEYIAHVKKCLIHGADIEARDDTRFWTPLFWAVYNKNRVVINILLAAGACVHVRDIRQRTPLHIAVELGDIYFTNMLIARGANIYASDYEGKKPLDLALQRDDTIFIVYFRKLHNLTMREVWLKILKQTKLEKFAKRIVSFAYST